MKSKKYLFLICLCLLSSFCIPKNIALAEYAAHDIAVTKIGFEEQTVTSGDVVFLTVTVEVQNKGIEDAQNVPITVYVGDEIIAQDTIPYLYAGKILNLSYDWAITAKEIPFKSNLRAEIGSIVREENIGNDKMSRGFTLIEKDGKIVPRYSVPVHKWITREAIYFLVKQRVGDILFRQEIVNYTEALIKGVEDEDCGPSCNFPYISYCDNVWARYLRHFYRPTDNKGYPKVGPGFYENAFEWGGTANTGNSYDYEDAKSAYNANKASAYEALGHVLHLIEDMSLPEHTHLECHDEDCLGLVCGTGSYEWYVTNHVFTDEYASLPDDLKYNLENDVDLGRIPEKYRGNNASSGVVKYNTLKEYIENLAKLSYYLNRYQANLSLIYGASGRLAEMFPLIFYCDEPGLIGTEVCCPNENWVIPNVGCLGDEWWETRSDEPETPEHLNNEPSGFYYIEASQNAFPEKYKTKWNPDDKSGNSDVYEYLPQNYDNDPSNDISLAELYARDLIPLAIRYVAGAIELFWLQTHPPMITSVNSGNPVVGSSSRQWIPIGGSNFASGFSATFKDVTNNVTYPTITDPARLSFISSSQVSVYAGVGTVSSTWSVIITNPDGSASNELEFSVVPPGTTTTTTTTSTTTSTTTTTTTTSTTTTVTGPTITTTTTSTTTTQPPGTTTTTTTTSTTTITIPGNCAVLLSTYITTASEEDVYISGSTAYLAAYDRLQVLNISNPAAAELLGSCPLPIWAWSVYVSGSTAYVANERSGLQIINVSNPASPSLLGNYDTPGYAMDVYVSGTTAYVADDSSLQIINVFDPTAPALLGSYPTPNAMGVYVSGSMAYVADGLGGLQIINVSDPTNPTWLGSYDTPGTASRVYVSGNIAYVADRWDSGLQIIDVSNPTNPTLLGSYNTPGAAVLDVYVSGSIAYVAVWADLDGGLQIIDVSPPTAPNLIGSYTPGTARGVYVSGSTAYVADPNNGLRIIDVSNCKDGVNPTTTTTKTTTTTSTTRTTTSTTSSTTTTTRTTTTTSTTRTTTTTTTTTTLAGPWTTAGSTGTVDDADVYIAVFSGPTVTVSDSVAVATLDMRYNIVPIDGLLDSSGAIRLKVRFRDNGGAAQVIVKLVRLNPLTGATATMMTFDSNNYAASSSFQTRSINNCPSSISFDFFTRVYYIEATLKKYSSTGAPGLSGIALGFTNCP